MMRATVGRGGATTSPASSVPGDARVNAARERGRPNLRQRGDVMSAALSSWREGPAKQAILDFVTAAGRVPVDERVAVFDNDGTLWCEKPVPIQMDFILRRLVEMAQADPALRDRQPWKAAWERDHAWFDGVLKRHYAGDETDVKTLAAGVLAAHAGISVEDFEALADGFLRTTQHPTLGRGYHECAYAPMVEL